MRDKKTSNFFEKEIKENQKAFIYAPIPEEYIENEQIVIMEKKSSKTLTENNGGKSEGPINGKNL